MMNKGLEIIEAHFLFGIPESQIDVVVHPQSVIHSLVEYHDGSTLAQLGTPDMRTPIAVALAWPDRMPVVAPGLDLAKIGQLTFETADPVRFPALAFARRALQIGGRSYNSQCCQRDGSRKFPCGSDWFSRYRTGSGKRTRNAPQFGSRHDR